MNMKRSRLTAIMSLIISVLALYAALRGIVDQNLYKEVFLAGTLAEPLIGGSIAQDIITVPLALIMGLLSVLFLRKPCLKCLIGIIGLATYTFYAYGLYTMQGQYTSIYLVYLAIFSLSIYSIIFGLISFRQDEVSAYSVPKKALIAAGFFLGLILVVLVPVWLLMITRDIANLTPANTYAVFVLDLGIVFPALGITLIYLWRKSPFALVLAGVTLIKAFTVCLSWGVGEWFGPYYRGSEVNYVMAAIPSVLTLIALVIMIFYFRGLQKSND